MNILEIEEFVSKHSMKDIFIHCNTLASSPSSDNIEELIGFLSVKYYIMERYITIRYIPRLIIAIGKPGIEAIEKLIRDKRGYVREAAILEVLFAASEGKEASIDCDESQPWILHPPISREISQLAHEAFVRYIIDSLKDSDLFFDLSQFIILRRRPRVNPWRNAPLLS